MVSPAGTLRLDELPQRIVGIVRPAPARVVDPSDAPVSVVVVAADDRARELERENAKLRKRAERAEALVEVQKKSRSCGGLRFRRPTATAQGGAIVTMLVGAAGDGPLQPVADEDVGAGVPTLLGGFIAVPDAEGIRAWRRSAATARFSASCALSPLCAVTRFSLTLERSFSRRARVAAAMADAGGRHIHE